jgi:hypothetical protein
MPSDDEAAQLWNALRAFEIHKKKIAAPKRGITLEELQIVLFLHDGKTLPEDPSQRAQIINDTLALLSKGVEGGVELVDTVRPRKKMEEPERESSEAEHHWLVLKLERHIKLGTFSSKRAFCNAVGIDESEYYRWQRRDRMKAPGYAQKIKSKINTLPDV